MTERARRMAAAIALGLAVSTTVAACTPGGGTMSDDQVAARLETAVVEAVPLADDAYVGFARAGSPTSRTVLVRIYVKSPATAELAQAADATLKTVWGGMPVQPASISFEAFDGAKPAAPKNGSLGNIGLTDVVAALGVGYVGSTGETLQLSEQQLSARYGAWTKPAAE